jgi:hypothetical protein
VICKEEVLLAKMVCLWRERWMMARWVSVCEQHHVQEQCTRGWLTARSVVPTYWGRQGKTRLHTRGWNQVIAVLFTFWNLNCLFQRHNLHQSFLTFKEQNFPCLLVLVNFHGMWEEKRQSTDQAT